jgi:light-regulated signal transduction histidine kinase (bacteriophytochrome)
MDNFLQYEKAHQEIRKRAQAEAELRSLNEELEVRVASRTAQLQAAHDELEAFCYSVSHDLRAPLRSIDGFSELLQRSAPDVLNSESLGFLERIRGATMRMSDLIDDLLKLSRLSRQAMNMQDLDMSQMVRDISTEMRSREPTRSIDFDIEEQVTARGDPILIRSALENLIGNAIKFTSKKNHALIQFGQTRKGPGGSVIYFVRDNGAGFDMDYVTKLFGAFQRLHGAKEFPGSGIGLASVQRVIHRHGGRIWARGEVNQGASFYFTSKEADHESQS